MKTQWTATVTDESGQTLLLALFQDVDAYRWYEGDDHADTEVSGASEQDAIDAAEAAWKNWGIQILDCTEGK